MNYLVIDTESTGGLRESKGSALDPRNRLCYIGLLNSFGSYLFPIEYEVGKPYGQSLVTIGNIIADADFIVLFNAKHDLHWMRKYGLDYTKPIWDCQTAEFIIQAQQTPFPSLDNTAKVYGHEGKKDFLDEYRKKGIDTDGVPSKELEEYLLTDLLATDACFLGQAKYLEDKPLLKKLIWVNCQDELITQEMEWNGLKFDFKGLKENAIRLESRIVEIDRLLYDMVGRGDINWDSPNQVATILYGGDLDFESREEYLFSYKSPKKAPVVKTKLVIQTKTFPRLVEPLPRTKLPSGNYSTDSKVLQKLKAVAKAKSIVNLILERRGNQTQVDRYFRGIPKKYQAMGWQNNIVHGQLHHCVAITGRLSSSNPNQQNIDERARKCLVTRFTT